MKKHSFAHSATVLLRFFSVLIGIIIIVMILGFFSDEINELLYNKGEGLRVPGSSQEYVGSPYSDVYKELTETGFTNVILREAKDKAPSSRWIGKIQSISMNGEEDFFSGKKYKEDVTIIIVYYSE